MEEQHIDEETLESYSLARLTDPGELEAVENHLLHCPQCLSRQEAMDAYVRSMKAAAKTVASAPRKPRRRAVMWIAIAASAAPILVISTRQAPVTLHLTAMRDSRSFTAPASRSLLLHVDRTGLDQGPPLAWELAGSSYSGKIAADQANLKVPGLNPGQYWLRLREAASGDLLREFSLVVR